MARGRVLGWWLAGAAATGFLVVSASLLPSQGTAGAVPQRESRQPTGRRVDVRGAGTMAMAKLRQSASVKHNAVNEEYGNAHVHVVQPVLGGSFGLARDELGADPNAWEDALAGEEEAAAIEGIVTDKEVAPLLDEAEASAPAEGLDPLPPSPPAAAEREASSSSPSWTVSTEAGAPSLSTAGARDPEAAAVPSMTEADALGVAAAVASSTAMPVTEAPHTVAAETPGAVTTATTPGAVATEARSVTVAADTAPKDVAVSATSEAAAMAAAAKAAPEKPVAATAAEAAPPEVAATVPVPAAAVPVAPVTAGTPEAAAETPMVETIGGVAAPEAMATATEAAGVVPVAPEAVPMAPAAAPVDAAVPEGDESEATAAMSSVAAVEAWLEVAAASSPAGAVEARLRDLISSSPEAIVTPVPEEAHVASIFGSRAAASLSGSAIPAAAAPPPGAMAEVAPVPRALINEHISADSSSTVLNARLAENSKESVASKLRLLHRISLERDAQAKADHELQPPVEDAIAPDAGTVVDAYRRPPIHGRLVEGEDTSALGADVAVPIPDDALVATKNTTDSARIGEHASAAAVKRTRAVPAAKVAVKGSLPTQEDIPVVVKNVIPLSPDAAGDILVMDGEATLASAKTPPDAARPATNLARTAAAVAYSPSPTPSRGAPLAAEAAGLASAVTASSAVDEVAMSATASEAAANGAAARTHAEKPEAVVTTMATPSSTMAVTLSSQSDRLAATTTEPVRASEEANTMAAGAARAALDASDRVGPLPSPVVTPVVPSTELDSAATAVIQEPMPAVMVGQESPPDAAVAAANASFPANSSLRVNASSAAVGSPPLAAAASQHQPVPESARSYTQVASRVVAAAIEAVLREATASARASAAAGRGVSATATPSSLASPPSADKHVERPAAAAPSPSGKVRTAASRRPPSPPAAVRRAQSRRGSKRRHNSPVFRSPLPTSPSAAMVGGRRVVPTEGASTTPASAPASTGSHGVYLFAGDGSVWYSFAGRLARVGDDMAMGATATDTALVEDSMMGAEGANPSGAVREESLGRPEMTALSLKRMMSPGVVLARGLAATAVPHPPTLASLSLGLSQRPAPSRSSSPLPDLPKPVRWHRPATPAALAVSALDADTFPAADRAAIPWLVRAAWPAASAATASGTSSLPPDPPSEGASHFTPVVRVGGACHYNQTSCSCASRVSSVPPPAHPSTCIRYSSPGATASASSWCTAEPCEQTTPQFVCDCMGGATCAVERKIVDGWRRVRGGEGEGEVEAPAPAVGERFHCKPRERLISVVTCVDRCG